MRKRTSLFTSTILALNLIAIGVLILSAYSPYLNPSTFPFLANIGLGFPILILVQALFILFWLLYKAKNTQYALLGLLIVAPQLYKYSPFNRPIEPPKESLKILSYNVMSFGGLRKDAQGKNDILEYLSESNADIICLQEYGSSNNSKFVTPSDIQKSLKKYPYYKIHKVGANHSGNKLAIYSKHPITKSEVVDLSSSYNGVAMYTLNIRNEKVLILNCHLESNKITREDKATYERILKMENKSQLVNDTKGLFNKFIEAALIRQKQAQKVDSIVKISKLPYIIVCGDFNDSPLSYTNRLLETDLTNAFIQSGNGLGISYNQNKFYFRIDNILISKNIKAYNCQVDRSIKMSDHYPIWCYIAK